MIQSESKLLVNWGSCHGNSNSHNVKFKLIEFYIFLKFFTFLSDNVCQNKADGTYIADPYDCKVFYECSSGVAVKFTCPPGTTWDQAILSCDDKRVDC